MSELEKKQQIEQAEKLFQAFSGIDETLLIRSEKKKSNLLTFRTLGTAVAACIGLMLFGSVAVVYTFGGRMGGGKSAEYAAPQEMYFTDSDVGGTPTMEVSRPASENIDSKGNETDCLVEAENACTAEGANDWQSGAEALVPRAENVETIDFEQVLGSETYGKYMRWMSEEENLIVLEPAILSRGETVEGFIVYLDWNGEKYFYCVLNENCIEYFQENVKYLKMDDCYIGVGGNADTNLCEQFLNYAAGQIEK